MALDNISGQVAAVATGSTLIDANGVPFASEQPESSASERKIDELTLAISKAVDTVQTGNFVKLSALLIAAESFAMGMFAAEHNNRGLQEVAKIAIRNAERCQREIGTYLRDHT